MRNWQFAIIVASLAALAIIPCIARQRPKTTSPTITHEEAVREAGRLMAAEIETRDVSGAVIKNPTKADLIVANRALSERLKQLQAENERLAIYAPFGRSAQMWSADGKQ